MKKNYYLLLLFLIVSIGACKKTEKPQIEVHSVTLTKPQNAISSESFDWETVSVMPTVPGTQILIPWASGVSRQFSPEIAGDFKKVDGWELVYSTFSSKEIPDVYYFILYNKFRGLLRMYYYHKSATTVNSDNIAHTLKVIGTDVANSPLMNFAGADLVEFNQNLQSASTLELWQLANATWYAFEYEIAYDKNLALKNPFALSFQWPVTANTISNINLNGTSIGTITGNITLPGGDLTISPNITANGRGSINIKGSSDVDKLKPSIGASLFSSFKDLVTKGLTKVAGGLVDKLFSGIFGGKSGGSQDNVNLKINTQISLTGKISNNALIGSQVFNTPGYDQTNAQGRVPLYNQPLGVFYLSNKPTVIETTHISTTSTGLPAIRTYVYSIDYSKLHFDLNPAVTNIATVQQRYSEVILSGYTEGLDHTGTVESVGNLTYLTGSLIGVKNQRLFVVGIRVVFDVIPNNGSPKSVLVKTFTANLDEVTVYDPPGEEQW
ncbi:hypothetical protein H7F33_10820 [Pedobacter sp. PAMC26386]|nr:hypothetical protein H7F33_10820 [Pedobacter sp. PAMC26386]